MWVECYFSYRILEKSVDYRKRFSYLLAMVTGSPAPITPSIPNAPRYRRVLDHPGFRLFESVLAVLGIVLAIFFYYQSRFRREPYFYVDPTRNILVNRELAIGDKLSVTFAGRPTQHGDITAMQCYFWNAGRAP